jgi:hypothetical protein
MTGFRFSSPPLPEWLWDPFSLLFKGYIGILYGGGGSKDETVSSSPSRADGKTVCNFNSSVCMRLQGVVLGKKKFLSFRTVLKVSVHS